MNNQPYKQESYHENIPKELSLEKWQKTVNVISRVFNAPAAWITQANIKGLEALVTSKSIEEKFPAGTSFAKDVNIYCKTVVESADILYVKNAEKEGVWENNPEYTDFGFVSYLGVPLQLPGGEIFGTLCVLDTQETNYSDGFIELMWQMKELINSDLKNLLLIKQLQAKSINDELTSIYNRRGFLENSHSLVGLAKRNNMALSLMYFDLNNLKPVNDVYGHEAGDFLIKSFATALKESIRDEDIVARLGGDEFCFLGIHTESTTNEIILERIQSIFEQLTHGDSRIKKPSFSVGEKVFTNSDDFNIDLMLSQVDKLMYENKKMMKEKQNT